MHNYIVNASIQIVPLAQDRHPYEWVDEAITIIQASGIKHEVSAFQTVLEGTYKEVMQVIHDVQEHLFQKGCAEWITQVQLQIRTNGDITADDKTAKYQSVSLAS
ncbi:uncharacterized protein, MTH1187 family [Cnuella takakiae]|uniref:Uncharacterized protein, MTH1187 family n=1 Tax=Cnuella takakiae TaxID=1302690 RepID=A0A1M4VG11_9BACT|nr:thiamine-binding protein [Cnuella takakiae]OLY92606.1 hypothetical protein BUE76_12435 [Cnuella takakiae]SHE67919.1 uncharacterized protein, MTH1187 family [Cnuella takakiae]